MKFFECYKCKQMLHFSSFTPRKRKSDLSVASVPIVDERCVVAGRLIK